MLSLRVILFLVEDTIRSLCSDKQNNVIIIRKTMHSINPSKPYIPYTTKLHEEMNLRFYETGYSYF